jgi:hypothetical protein
LLCVHIQPVLTSPRSLEACLCLGLEPGDLVVKRPEEFKVLKGVTLSAAAASERYERYESKRQQRLQAARAERNRLIAESKCAMAGARGVGRHVPCAGTGWVPWAPAPLAPGNGVLWSRPWLAGGGADPEGGGLHQAPDQVCQHS